MVKIILADHHPIIRMAIKILLSYEDNLQIIGEVSNGKQLDQLLKDHIPDVLILEIDLPDAHGLLTVKSILSSYPEIKILILSSFPEKMYALPSLRAGSIGYVSKTASTQVIKDAIVKVSYGEQFLSETIQFELSKNKRNKQKLQSSYKKLSTREAEVLTLIARGSRNRDIAKTLEINEKTVSTYKTRLLKKLNAQNIADLIHQSRILESIDL